MAGLRTIWILFLLVALVGASPVFAQNLTITLTPAAACPGMKVIVTFPIGDAAGGLGNSIMQTHIVQTFVISSNPSGLIGTQTCGIGACSFVVSQHASCGHYEVILSITVDGQTFIFTAPFDVPSTCCPVGGCIEPVNTFAVLSPWLAVIGLVGSVAVLGVVVKKRRSR